MSLVTHPNFNAMRDEHLYGSFGHPTQRHNSTQPFSTDEWYSPKIEIIYAGFFLVEPGELFKFKQNFLNDDKMVSIGQVLRYHNTKANRRHQRRCDGCGKKFVNYKYLALHRVMGCNRKPADKHFYELALEELEEAGYVRNPTMDALRY